jgi:1-phosphofructokinase
MEPDAASRRDGPEVVVMSPGLLTSITIERSGTGADEIHVHPAGQGYWVARMAGALGARPVLVTTCGGEAGVAVAALVGTDVDLRVVPVDGSTGLYVDDRRSGERQRVATTVAAPLDRHAVDDLVSLTLVEGPRAGTAVLTGSNDHDTIPADVFATLSAGLHALDVAVVVDLSGDELRGALDGHVDAVKISDEELAALTGSDGGDRALHRAATDLRERTGADVFVTCSDSGAFAFTDDGPMVGRAPLLPSVEHRGAGDSFTSAIAIGRSRGLSTGEQFRLALAASAANVLRHGLGSATVDVIRAMQQRVEVVPA